MGRVILYKDCSLWEETVEVLSGTGFYGSYSGFAL